jgi:SAM-dependent methyltransferase
MGDEEVARLRAAYAARGSSDVHGPLRPDKIAEHAARNEAWALGLRRVRHDLGRVIEVGAGSGAVLRWLQDAGARGALGFDLLPARAEAARSAGLAVWVADGRHLPVRSSSVDTVVAATLFSSLLAAEIRAAVAGEIRRIVRPGGVVLVYDFLRGNPRNPDVAALRPEELQRLFPGWLVYRRRTTLAPPIARRFVDRPVLRHALGSLPLARTHFAAVLQRPESPP